MKKRWARVAEPTSTSRRPVANGSSVPACPTLCLSPVRSRSWRRTRATTSCDVIPAGFAYRITPDCVTARSRLLVSVVDSALVVARPAARHQEVCTLLDRHPESARSRGNASERLRERHHGLAETARVRRRHSDPVGGYDDARRLAKGDKRGDPAGRDQRRPAATAANSTVLVARSPATAVVAATATAADETGAKRAAMTADAEATGRSATLVGGRAAAGAPAHLRPGAASD